MLDLSTIDTIASYRNVTFYFISSNYTGGHKSVTHKYVGSDKSFNEQLGLQPKEFDLSIVISGSDYLVRKQALISALEESGTGVLTLPLFGQLLVKPKTWNFSENISKFGLLEGNITFIEDTNTINPNISTILRDFISNIKKQINPSIIAFFKDNFNSLENNSLAFFGALFKAQSIINEFNLIKNNIGRYTDRLNIFKSKVKDLNNNIAFNIKNPEVFANNLSNIFTDYENLFVDQKQQFSNLTNFYNFGDNDTKFKSNSSNSKVIENNNNLINTTVQSLAFVSSLLISTKIDYDNDLEVNDYKDTIETQFEKLNNNNEIDFTLKNDLSNMKIETFRYLDNLQVDRVILVVLKKYLTVEQISYIYYGNLDRAEDIYKLNNLSNPFTIGKTLVFESAS